MTNHLSLHRHIYWTDWSKPSIERVNFDGTDRKVLVNEQLQFPNGIDVSFEGESAK